MQWEGASVHVNHDVDMARKSADMEHTRISAYVALCAPDFDVIQ